MLLLSFFASKYETASSRFLPKLQFGSGIKSVASAYGISLQYQYKKEHLKAKVRVRMCITHMVLNLK